MRIPFPERVPLNRVAIFAVALFAIQRLEGTDLYFSAGCAIFILIAALTFNTAGGLTRASGAYVFFYSVLVVIIGLCYKAFLGEPAQSNLLAPHADIDAYVGSISLMFASVVVSRRLSRKSGLLQGLLKESSMHRASVGCIVFGLAGGFLIALLGAARLQSAFNQINQLVPLGVIIGVMYEIRRSGGTRSLNLPIVLGGLYMFIWGGIIFFSKQAMLLPFLCWLLPVGALRFRLSAWQVISVFLAGFVFFYYLTPYSQYGRNQVPELATMSQRVDISISLLEHLDETRQIYNQAQAENVTPESRGLNAYYNTPQGFWERLQFISVDDALINFTDQGHVFGLMPLKYAILGIVPHVFWPNKPDFHPGFTYAMEISGQTPDPDAPEFGISFSPTGEAYHLARWTGILVIAPILWCTLFVVFDSLFGDLRASPWGLLTLTMISHSAPEGGISGIIYLLSFGVEILIACAIFATWFAPLIAIPVLGPDRKTSEPQISFRPSPTPLGPR